MVKRGITAQIEEPERAADPIVTRCRAEIEGGAKAAIRRALIPIFRAAYGLAEVGEGFQGPRSGKIKIGRGSRIGRYAYLGAQFECHGPVVIGDLCLISSECKVIGADHAYDIVGTPTRLGSPGEARPVTVFGMDTWIGMRALIKEGVRIGTGAIVGSGALVTRDVAPYSIVGGVPARVIGHRFAPGDLARHEAIISGAA